MNEARKSILDLSNSEALNFLLKSESYCSVDLPPYFVFGDLIAEVNTQLGKSNNPINRIKNPRDYEDVNYTILNNKDGKYPWRPLQLEAEASGGAGGKRT